MAQVIRRASGAGYGGDFSIRAQRIVYAIISVISGLLLIRLLLALFGANANNDFARFVYAITAPFVAPFVGLFSINAQLGVARFEVETLVALVVVVLIGWVINSVLGVGRSATARDDTRTEVVEEI